MRGLEVLRAAFQTSRGSRSSLSTALHCLSVGDSTASWRPAEQSFNTCSVNLFTLPAANVQGVLYLPGSWSSISQRAFKSPASRDKPADAPPHQPARTWLNSWLPSSAVPYAQLMRLDRPIGTWLLAWPCMWSIALAAPLGGLPDLRLLGLFGVGSVLLRGAGCTVNDLWDMRLDALVERTRSRPLPSRSVTVPQAAGLLGAQLLLGLGILVQLNTPSILLGASSLLLVGAYPYMKRITYWPQAFLGLTFNWGALLGHVAATGHLDWQICLPLYASGVCWTLVYDTIYAHQDKNDDVLAGVKSTALLFASHNRMIMSGFALSHLALLAAAGWSAGILDQWPFTVALCAASTHIFWQILSVDLESGADCMSKFVSNKYYGAMIFGGIVAAKLV
ncbi:hypothetical protein WJX74_010561 [Apatococcus lobatus]|uniref:4-hydroxybenzoate polyprenyltransferase, mitochondrial n=2 Tax=Apatococcus TaxID=904362 RepID=A0AAW1SSP5_9CHLO